MTTAAVYYALSVRQPSVLLLLPFPFPHWKTTTVARNKGASIYDVRKFLGLFDPLPHLPRTEISWLWYFCLLLGETLPPPSADVIYGSPLTALYNVQYTMWKWQWLDCFTWLSLLDKHVKMAIQALSVKVTLLGNRSVTVSNCHSLQWFSV